MGLPRRHVTLRLTGRVQGVFFRACAKDQANDLGVKGFVRNEPDGSIYLELEGEHEAVGKMVSWCVAGGPPKGRVDTVDMKEGEWKGHVRFEIV